MDNSFAAQATTATGVVVPSRDRAVPDMCAPWVAPRRRHHHARQVMMLFSNAPKHYVVRVLFGLRLLCVGVVTSGQRMRLQELDVTVSRRAEKWIKEIPWRPIGLSSLVFFCNSVLP